MGYQYPYRTLRKKGNGESQNFTCIGFMSRKFLLSVVALHIWNQRLASKCKFLRKIPSLPAYLYCNLIKSSAILLLSRPENFRILGSQETMLKMHHKAFVCVPTCHSEHPRNLFNLILCCSIKFKRSTRISLLIPWTCCMVYGTAV